MISAFCTATALITCPYLSTVILYKPLVYDELLLGCVYTVSVNLALAGTAVFTVNPFTVSALVALGTFVVPAIIAFTLSVVDLPLSPL